jgi:hypothetical protein
LCIIVAFYATPCLAQDVPVGSGVGVGDRSNALGLSSDYNPALGASLLLGGEYLSRDASDMLLPSAQRETIGRTGIKLQEVELVLAAAVDPTLRADVIVTMEGGDDGTFAFDLEEAYVTTLSLRHVAIRAGKMHLPFGRHNTLHAHAFPFIDAPVVNVALLGAEGLNSVAGEAAFLIPAPWFLELTVVVADGHNDTLFRSSRFGGLAFGGRVRNLVDLDDETTMELGASYYAGQNFTGGWTHVFGGHLNLTWRPAGRELYHQVTWQAEYIQVRRTGERAIVPAACDDPTCDGPDPALLAQAEVTSGLGGFYTYLAARVGQQWWVQARFDALGYPKGESVPTLDPSYRNPLDRRLHRVTALAAFVPTEFAALRLQYSYVPEEDVHQALLQLNVSIGAHPAHAY